MLTRAVLREGGALTRATLREREALKETPRACAGSIDGDGSVDTGIEPAVPTLLELITLPKNDLVVPKPRHVRTLNWAGMNSIPLVDEYGERRCVERGDALREMAMQRKWCQSERAEGKEDAG